MKSFLKKHWLSVTLGAGVVFGSVATVFNVYSLQNQQKNKPVPVSYSQFLRFAQNKKLKSVKIDNSQPLATSNLIEGNIQITTRIPPNENIFERLPSNVDVKTLPPLLDEKTLIQKINPFTFDGLLYNLILIYFLGRLYNLGLSYYRQKNDSPESNLQDGKHTKIGSFKQYPTGVTFADVEGIDEAKQEVQEIVNFLKNPEKSGRLGAKIPKGVLLIGEPGGGKTLLAKAVAGEAGVPFLSVSGSSFDEKWVGVGAARVRKLFKEARQNQPCVIFIDEIDAVGRKRNENDISGVDATLNMILAEMDGFSPREQVIVMAATNRAETLDNALKRPGRFDRKVYVQLPDISGRARILSVYLKKITASPDINVEILAKGTPGWSGAELANLPNEAAIIATNRGANCVTMEDLEFAKDKYLMGSERRSHAMTEEDKRKTARHEAGHALHSICDKNCDSLHKVSIIPRGQALGVTMSLPEKEHHNYTKDQLLSLMVNLYCGQAAEEVAYGPGQISTGASNDIERVTQIARAMVMKYGMAEGISRQYYDRTTLSEEALKKIDDAIAKLTNKAYDDAIKFVTEHEEEILKLESALMEKETLSSEEVHTLLGRDLMVKSKIFLPRLEVA